VSGCGPESTSLAAPVIAIWLPLGGFALTESIVGQTSIVPLTWMLPFLDVVWQSMFTATDVVALATTLNAAELPLQVAVPSVDDPVSEIE
jgi:hypothetical protein